MKVTFYANCIVNNRYNEVFHNSVFDDYLNTLEQTDFEVEDVYTTFNGRFAIQNVLTNNKNIYTYNYMKVETDSNQFEQDGFTRYCFIDNIDIRNGYVYVDYSEDIWHSYSKGINIRNSYLTRSRQLQYGDKTIPVYRLPLPYGGNNLPSITSGLNIPNADKYLIVARLQTYKLSSSGGKSTNQTASYVLISNKTSVRITEGTVNPFNDINELEETLSVFERQSAGENYTDHSGIQTGFEGNTYFEIDNIHVVPRYFFPDSIANVKPNIGAIMIPWTSGESTVTLYYHCYNITEFIINQNNPLIPKYYSAYNGVITHDFTNVSFGPISKQIQLDNNGNDISYSILIGGTVHEFSIMLAIQNKIVDITNCFEVVLPFNSVTGDVTAQRKIAFNVGLITQAMRVASGVGTIASGFSSSFTPAQLASTGAVVPYEYFDSPWYYASPSVSLPTQTFNYPSAKDIKSGGSDIVGGVIEIARLLTPKYKSETAVVSHTQGILNCVSFPVLTKMVADNTEEVQKAIDNIGYSVDEIFNTEAINTTFVDWNVVQFGFINLYGDFPQNIANALKAILRNGVKIWYTSNV